MINKLLLSTAILAALTVAASAADLMVEAPAPVVAPEPAGWDGAYIGASVGYGPGTLTFDDCEGSDDPGCSIAFSGLFGGVQAGYNFTVGDAGIVLGIEGDSNWGKETGAFEGVFGGGDEIGVDWTASFTGHVGIAIGSVMPYALGGIAFAHAYDARTFGELPGFPGGIFDLALPEGDSNGDAVHVGYTIGAGLGLMFTDNVSGFVEARYSDYGSQNYRDEDGNSMGSAQLADTTLKGGINFHF